MITAEQLMQMSPEDSLWRVIYSDGGEALINVAGHEFFLDKEEAEEYAVQMNIIKRLRE